MTQILLLVTTLEVTQQRQGDVSTWSQLGDSTKQVIVYQGSCIFTLFPSYWWRCRWRYQELLNRLWRKEVGLVSYFTRYLHLKRKPGDRE